MDAVVAAAVSLVLAAAGGQVSASTGTMRADIKRTVVVLFGIAAAFYFAFILMSVLNAA